MHGRSLRVIYLHSARNNDAIPSDSFTAVESKVKTFHIVRQPFRFTTEIF